MKRAATTVAIVCWALCGSASAQVPVTSADRALLEATEPQRNFFMKQLGSCPQCQTLTVAVANEKLDATLLGAFRSIAERLGKDNAGAVASSYELWKNWKIFSDYGCPEMDQQADRYVLFLDRTGSFCIVFPFRTDRQLLGVLEIIERNLKDAGYIDPVRWRDATSALVEKYLLSTQGIDTLRAAALAFVDHVANLLRRRR